MPNKLKKPTKRSRRAKAEAALKELAPDQQNDTIDFETLVREEYMRLHRKYRLMEDVRRTLAGQGNKISLRGKLLGYLREQKQSTLLDVLNATSDTYKRKDKQTVRTILSILEDYENYNQEISDCLKNIHEMEENVDKIMKRLIDQKLKVQAIFGRSMTVGQAAKRKDVLENRLFNVVTKFDQYLSKNRDMREEINMMLKARGLFHSRTLAIKRQSARIKRAMGETVYLATQAYEQRDDLVTRIHAIRERNDKESKAHVLEIKEFNRILHHDSKLHGFMLAKNQNRNVLESADEREERRNHAKLEELNATLKAYKKSFNDIFNMGRKGLTTEELSLEYLENEQSNFGRFRILSDLNNEISFLHQDVTDIVADIEELQRKRKVVEKERKLELEEMAGIYKKKGAQLEQAVQLWETAEKQMKEFIDILDELFNAANCDNSSVIQLLGNLGGIAPHNAMLCMHVIESRINEMMFDKQVFEIRKSVEINNAHLPKLAKTIPQGGKQKNVVGGPYAPQILITGGLNTEEEEEEKSSRVRPLVYDEIRIMILSKEPQLKIPGVVLPDNPLLSKPRMSVDPSASVSAL